VLCADTTDFKDAKIIRMLHMVDVPYLLRLAHFTDGIGGLKVLNGDACPPLVRKTRN
jgi:hypothetical protein